MTNGRKCVRGDPSARRLRDCPLTGRRSGLSFTGVARTDTQKEIDALAKKVERGGRRLKALLLKAEDLHSQSEALHRELAGIHGENKEKQNP